MDQAGLTIGLLSIPAPYEEESDFSHTYYAPLLMESSAPLARASHIAPFIRLAVQPLHIVDRVISSSS